MREIDVPPFSLISDVTAAAMRIPVGAAAASMGAPRAAMPIAQADAGAACRRWWKRCAGGAACRCAWRRCKKKPPCGAGGWRHYVFRLETLVGKHRAAFAMLRARRTCSSPVTKAYAAAAKMYGECAARADAHAHWRGASGRPCRRRGGGKTASEITRICAHGRRRMVGGAPPINIFRFRHDWRGCGAKSRFENPDG